MKIRTFSAPSYRPRARLLFFSACLILGSWMPVTASASLETLLGPTLQMADGTTIPTKNLAGKTVGLYFSAGWCGPCVKFTPQLAMFRAAHSSEFEVVLVGLDRSERDMKAYMKKSAMPWPAVPYGSPLRQSLAEKFKVQGIPRLVVLDAMGNVVASNGTNDIRQSASTAMRKWVPEPPSASPAQLSVPSLFSPPATSSQNPVAQPRNNIPVLRIGLSDDIEKWQIASTEASKNQSTDRLTLTARHLGATEKDWKEEVQQTVAVINNASPLEYARTLTNSSLSYEETFLPDGSILMTAFSLDEPVSEAIRVVNVRPKLVTAVTYRVKKENLSRARFEQWVQRLRTASLPRDLVPPYDRLQRTMTFNPLMRSDFADLPEALAAEVLQKILIGQLSQTDTLINSPIITNRILVTPMSESEFASVATAGSPASALSKWNELVVASVPNEQNVYFLIEYNRHSDKELTARVKTLR